MSTEAGTFWVHGNATEHLAQYALGNLGRGVSTELVNIGSQAQLASLQAALVQGAEQGLVYGEMFQVGGWEIIIGASGQTGSLPAVIHALLLGL